MNGLTDQLLAEVREEAERQDRNHPAGYPATRDGVRLGIATAGDELREAYDEWRQHKNDLGNPQDNTRGELLQAAAVILRTIREMGAS